MLRTVLLWGPIPLISLEISFSPTCVRYFHADSSVSSASGFDDLWTAANRRMRRRSVSFPYGEWNRRKMREIRNLRKLVDSNDWIITGAFSASSPFKTKPWAAKLSRRGLSWVYPCYKWGTSEVERVAHSQSMWDVSSRCKCPLRFQDVHSSPKAVKVFHLE